MKHRKDIYMKTAPQLKPGESIPEDEPKSSADKSKVSEVWLPESNTAFKLFFSANLCSALLNNITDCDETFNYWEPLHHLMYGEGFQTWEYSPIFAIRSWAYIWIHSVFTWIYLGFLNHDKLMVFYFIRMVLGMICSICEVHFYEGVALRFGNNVARLTLAFLVFSTGMFISSTAFLPSSFCMYMTLLLMGSWLQGQLHISIIAVAASAIIGWPFSVALGIPLAIDVLLRRRKYAFFLKWCGIALLTMLLPCFLIDSYFYAKPVVACLNILLYNVFTDHGPDIYGTEPLSFYFLNGFLNFNFVFVLALCSIIIIPIAEYAIVLKYKGYQPPTLLVTFTLLPMYVWMGIFFSQPHKEERFLFPIYPLICLCGAISIATVQKLYCVFKLHHFIKLHWITLTTLFVYALVSLSRTLALHQGYHSSIEIYSKLQGISDSVNTSSGVTICAGKEWYRFPSNFFLPHNFTLKFIESDFRAQLPQHFSEVGISGTRAVLNNFNDQNLEEKDRYINVKDCNFLIDFNTGESTRYEPIFSADKNSWDIEAELDFLNSKKSLSKLFRAYYVPYFFETKNTFGKYQLLRSKINPFKKKRTD